MIASIFVLSPVCLAQVHLDALEKARQIKLLQTNRESVRNAFNQFVLDEGENSDDFESQDAEIEVFYSTGTCDEDERELWNVAKGKAVRIEIRPKNEFQLADFGFNVSSLMKEQVLFDHDELFVYHDKSKGIAIDVSSDLVESIYLFPPITSKAKACKYKTAREFISMKSWFGSSKLEDRKPSFCPTADVTNLTLSHNEISATVSKQIDISTTASDPENDVLTYNYTVSVGKITGTGAKVVWDLSGVPPGSYTITAAVDDGCGLCGQTKTVTVVVK